MSTSHLSVPRRPSKETIAKAQKALKCQNSRQKAGARRAVAWPLFYFFRLARAVRRNRVFKSYVKSYQIVSNRIKNNNEKKNIKNRTEQKNI
jgi:hypothetical protein